MSYEFPRRDSAESDFLMKTQNRTVYESGFSAEGTSLDISEYKETYISLGDIEALFVLGKDDKGRCVVINNGVNEISIFIYRNKTSGQKFIEISARNTDTGEVTNFEVPE